MIIIIIIFSNCSTKQLQKDYVKRKIDKTQKTCKCRLRSDRDETVHHIINKCSKLVQKENKTRHDWVGKVINWELCKKLKVDQTIKCYMHKPESLQENEARNSLRF